MAMKMTLALILTLTSFSALASKANIFCKVSGKVISALSEDGHFDCAESLLTGTACFTGSRKAVIELINQDTFNWDEEWLARANYKGRDAISYSFIDGPNEWEERISIDRCTHSYFKN